MITEISQLRFSLSMIISLLLHLLVLFSLHLYMQPKKEISLNNGTLHVRLANLPPAKPRPLHHKKILTTQAPSPIKVAPTPPPSPVASNTPAQTQGDAITGIAMPGAIVTPFSGYKPEGNAAFQQRNAQQNAMRAYQEHIMTMQARQQAEREAQFLTQQLQQMLMAIFSDKSITGNCLIDSGASKFSCSDENLSNEIAQHESPVMGLFKRLQGLGKNYRGFSVMNATNSINTILINEHTLTKIK